MYGKLIFAYWAILGLIICPARAANFEIDALPSAAFDPITFAPIPLTLDTSGNLVGSRPMVVQVDIDVLSSGYNPAHDERGLGAMTFNLDLFGSFSNTTRPGWRANNPLIDASSLRLDQPVSLWQENTDAGQKGDLKNILLANPFISNPSPFDPRPLLTIGTPVKVGSIYVDWDGQGAGGLRVSPEEVAFAQLSNGALQMFQPGEYTMIGGMLHTPGWQPPPPPVTSPPPAPAALPPPASSPPTVSAPPASAPVVSPPITSSPAAPPVTSPADPAPAAPPPNQTPSTAPPATSTGQSAVDLPSNANSPLLPAPAITVWRPDWERLTAIQFPLTTGIDAATPMLISDGQLQLVELNRAALTFNSATAAAFSDSVPEPSAVVLAAIGVLAGLPFLKNRQVASTQVCR